MAENGSKRHREEIPDTWIDFFMYPAGVVVGVLLAGIIHIISR